ncbi:MAG: SCP2 sterol-binding domain-containing protein [Actinobacteria bacterium]|nr:SCP2 sterol-binding domain-containing protein [Actinomycetota bacterium]
MEVGEDVTVREYFEEHVPKIFEEQVSGISSSGMEGTDFSVQFDISGAEKQTYGIIVKDAKELEVVSGPIKDPIVTLELSEDAWREAVTGKLEGAVDAFMDMGQMANRTRYDLIKDTKGTMGLLLSRPGGTDLEFKVIFNGAESPKTTFKASLEDWVKISRGELEGTAAYMSGSLKIEGDLPFAMALGNLVS